MFEMLFRPIAINKTVVKNRIAYPSLGLLYSLDGKLNDRYRNFYRERARGGAGIVTVGPVGFDFVGSGPVALQIGSDDAIDDFKELTKMIKDEGACAWIQLFHAGAYSYSKLLGGIDPIAPSAVYSNYSKTMPREMTLEDIKQVQQGFVDAAARAKEAGFDGVEIIGSAGYLITQFLSPLTNKRTDEYGGSFENRTRFPREIIEMMRKRLGPDYPISIRMAGNDFVPGSNTDEDARAIAKVYEKAGVDLINVTGGWHESRIPQLPMELPRGVYSYLALNIKKAVNVPVIASNRISDPYLAEQIIKDGIADMVNLGRVLIADPYWPQKAKSGRVDEIIPCIACSQGCTDQLFSAKPVFCLANPRAGYEGERIVKKTATPKKVMVIGAGPGGLQAAITAAEMGHEVSLYEKSNDIGGQLWIAAVPPHKGEILELIRYFDTMIEKYDIDIYLETEVTIDLIKEVNPDFIIAAEGAEPLIPPIEGIDDPKVISAWDVLKNDPPLGEKIAVIGGGAVGLETAEFLALKGTISPETLYFLFRYEAESVDRLRELITKGTKEVTVFEMLPKVGKGVGKSTKWVLMGNIERLNVNVITNARVISVKDATVKYEINGKIESAQFDNVVNAVGSRSVRNVADKLDGVGIPFKVIGDSVRPAQIHDAIHEGFLAALEIG
ncbi:MAG: FAD-dependent oxidoreductase [Spirochaetes bacterium]|nr:FAD-dependent oxidoreductase [Spirochaetota bacterium]